MVPTHVREEREDFQEHLAVRIRLFVKMYPHPQSKRMAATRIRVNAEPSATASGGMLCQMAAKNR